MHVERGVGDELLADVAQSLNVAYMVEIEAEQVAVADEMRCFALGEDARKGYEIELCAFGFLLHIG